MSHLVADTTEELLQIISIIGVNPKHIQHPGTPKEHFDICFSKRKLALVAGAIPIGFRQYAEFIQARSRVCYRQLNKVGTCSLACVFAGRRDNPCKRLNSKPFIRTKYPVTPLPGK